jgi:hypothetical protein
MIAFDQKTKLRHALIKSNCMQAFWSWFLEIQDKRFALTHINQDLVSTYYLFFLNSQILSIERCKSFNSSSHLKTLIWRQTDEFFNREWSLLTAKFETYLILLQKRFSLHNQFSQFVCNRESLIWLWIVRLINLNFLWIYTLICQWLIWRHMIRWLWYKCLVWSDHRTRSV